MADYSNLVTSAAECKLWIAFVGVSGSWPVVTGRNYNRTDSQTVTPVYAIGSRTSITNKPIAVNFSGSVSLQVGEYHQILNALNGAGFEYASLIYATGVSITVEYRNELSLYAQTETLLGINFTSVNTSIDANDVETTVDLAFQGTEIQFGNSLK